MKQIFVLLFFLLSSVIWGQSEVLIQYFDSTGSGGESRAYVSLVDGKYLPVQILGGGDDSTHTLLLSILVDIDTVTSMWKDVHDEDIKVIRIINIASEWARYTNGVLSIDKTNLDTDSTFAVATMNGYHYCSFDATGSGGTVLKVYRTNNPDADDGNSNDGNWKDISGNFLGNSAGVSDPDTTYQNITPIVCEKLLFKFTTSDNSNAIIGRPKRMR